MSARESTIGRTTALRRFVWIPLGLALGGLLVLGFGWIEAPATPDHKPPLQVHKSFPPQITDSNIELSHVFNVRNPSNKPVRILDMRTSCGCTSAELGKRALGPHESTQLHFSARVPLAETSEKLVVQLETDLPEQPVWIYSVSVDRYSPITLVPKQISLGAARPGATVEQKLYVEMHRFDDKPAAMPEFEVGNGLQSFSLAPDGDPVLTRLKDGVFRTTYALKITGTVGRMQGEQRSEMRLWLAGAESGRVLTVPVRWNVQGPISVTPLRVFFGAVRSGEKSARSAVLASADGIPFRILRFESPSQIVRATVKGPAQPANNDTANVPNNDLRSEETGLGWQQVEVEISLDGDFKENICAVRYSS